MIIMCDIDDVLNDLLPKTLTMYNSRTGKNIQLSDLTEYAFYDCLSPEDASGIISLFKDKRLWDSLRPLPGSQKGLKSLINYGHDVYLATATLPETLPWKIDWLSKYFPFINADNVIRIKNKGLLNCDVMIDDNIDNLANNLCDRVVLDYPWNQSASKDYAYSLSRAYNWKEIVNFVNEIERKNKEWEK